MDVYAFGLLKSVASLGEANNIDDRDDDALLYFRESICDVSYVPTDKIASLSCGKFLSRLGGA